jgi:hypothetical protein
MAAHARYSGRSAPTTGIHPFAFLKFALVLALLAGALWFVATGIGGELGTLVTGWFREL